jgi:hypothetical protein
MLLTSATVRHYFRLCYYILYIVEWTFPGSAEAFWEAQCGLILIVFSLLLHTMSMTMTTRNCLENDNRFNKSTLNVFFLAFSLFFTQKRNLFVVANRPCREPKSQFTVQWPVTHPGRHCQVFLCFLLGLFILENKNLTATTLRWHRELSQANQRSWNMKEKNIFE